MGILESRACQMIFSITCETCPLSVAGICEEMSKKISKKINLKNLSCADILYYWLKGVDLDPYEPKEKEIFVEEPRWGVPCEEDNQCSSSCPYHWTEWCPYE